MRTDSRTTPSNSASANTTSNTATPSTARLRAALCIGAIVAGLAPVGAQAQIGGAFGIRTATGTESNAANSARTGYEGRLTYDREFTARLGWRAELGYNQMQFQRTDDTLRFQVSENGFELLLQARVELRDGALSGVYAAAGPVASFRALCGSSGRFDSNGRVVCNEGETFLAGYAITTGYRWTSSERREMSLEVRYLGNVTAAQGGSLLAISIGVRRRAERDNQER